ncbi:hypothetical protein [Sphingobacterium suaedae]|uniref:3-oxoacyl-ACP synthase n=1 Tax=Sphingobacterium suaedae TaxID=1686402 RepID=A0ABW5KM43_9SPHI
MEREYIVKSCLISTNRIVVDGAVHWESSPYTAFNDFAKDAFRHLQVDYPKFYKMDSLSKLAFLAAEYLLEEADKEELALVLANRSGSLDTDIKHQESIQDEEYYFPSPATFVYTLANICAGELSIRHKLLSENIFLVAEQYPVPTVKAYASYLMRSRKAKQVLCGWIELFKENYNTVLYLVGPKGSVEHTEENIKELFK